jgi:hypothetical protein
MPARSTSLGVLQREHRISSQANPPLMAWSVVGDGSIGSPSDHIRSFQLSQSSRSACCSMVSALARPTARRGCRSSRALCRAPCSGPCGRLRRGAWGGASAPSGHPKIRRHVRAPATTRTRASNRLLTCRCVAGMCRPAAAARPGSRRCRRHKAGSRRWSGTAPQFRRVLGAAPCSARFAAGAQRLQTRD